MTPIRSDFYHLYLHPTTPHPLQHLNPSPFALPSLDGRNVRRERRIVELCNVAKKNANESSIWLFLKYYAHLKWNVNESTARAYIQTVYERLSNRGTTKE